MKRLTKGRKKPYHLAGGPLNGAGVLLSSPSTLPIKCKGERGRYVQTPKVPPCVLVWEAA